jgi:hypothetical protein
MNSAKRAVGCGRRELAAFVLTGVFAAVLNAQDAKPVTLQLKAQPGATWRYDYTYVAQITTTDDGNPADKYRQDVRVELSVETKVVSVRKDGRMTLEQKLTRAAQKVTGDGEVLVFFDTARPGELEKARTDPKLAVLVAAMDSTWRVVMESTGEVFDREITVPDAKGNPALKMTVTGFLDSVTDQTRFILPAREISLKTHWISGPFERAIPSTGGLKGETKGTLSALREHGGETVASILVERTAKLESNPDSAVVVEMTEFQEGGTLTLATGRGRIKSISLKGTISYKTKSERGKFTVRATNELEVAEGKP